VSKVSAEVREQSARIPWDLIIGMAESLVRVYFDINHDIL
jgi:uncharacterized protein with HEPN domain